MLHNNYAFTLVGALIGMFGTLSMVCSFLSTMKYAYLLENDMALWVILV